MHFITVILMSGAKKDLKHEILLPEYAYQEAGIQDDKLRINCFSA